MEYKTGQILLVHGKSKLAKIIQKFQQKNDSEAGYYNHSGLIIVEPHGVYVCEMAEVEGYKFRAATVFTPIAEYLTSDCSLLLLTPKASIELTGLKMDEWMRILYKYIGIPYDYKNLFIHQIWRLLKGEWIGRKKKKAWKRMVCHELTQKIWNEQAGIFTDWNQASVSNIYRNNHFEHLKIKYH